MSKRLTTADTLSLGFMVFAFFLGAGNIIFPPMAGMLAGENMPLAMSGFLMTAVGLPLIGLIAVAKMGGGVLTMTKQLPAWVGIAIALGIYIVIGPAFAAPRTGLVAYEIGMVPFLSEAGDLSQWLYTAGFFIVALLLALSPGKLMDVVGKVLTPALIVLLAILAVSAVIDPQDPIAAASDPWIDSPLTTGFLEGYMTMDALASLMFGMLVVDMLRRKGITDNADVARYLSIAAVIAAVGLAAVYISLFYLGATSSVLGAGAANGGVILAAYVGQVFGEFGKVILAAVVTLACLTTAVGLLSACSEYFNELAPKVSYKAWVVINAVVCALVANVGLSQLIAISIPVLFIVYPIAMALIVFAFAKPFISQTRPVLAALLISAVFVGTLSAIKVAGIEALAGVVELFSFLPLFDQHMAWAPLTVVIIIAGVFYKRNQPQLVAE
ncbi:branched-chain amino acid transport system II carrier protein [Ferrimonas senticii]|uniref:branched-chain amino acid transport system II carrier protein n=1 Tax=Ferrimonas senticii TaxID=394566 RepID=UPI0003FAB0DA|nr:branched-chain amino acid transport system II carrier protein [Ferrimonas senticii]